MRQQNKQEDKQQDEQPKADPLCHLRKLTSDLPPFPIEEAKDGHMNGCKIHKMTCGTSISWSLLSQPGISCARWYNSNGTEFPVHVHEQREWLVVYKGSVFMTIEGQDEVRLLPGMSVTISPNTKHSCRFVEDCWYLAITVPKSEDFPA